MVKRFRGENPTLLGRENQTDPVLSRGKVDVRADK